MKDQIESSTLAPPVAFLGICDRSSKVKNVDPRLSAYNLMGLRAQIVSSIYPMSSSALNLVFAIYMTGKLPKFRIKGLSEDALASFWIDVNFSAVFD